MITDNWTFDTFSGTHNYYFNGNANIPCYKFNISLTEDEIAHIAGIGGWASDDSYFNTGWVRIYCNYRTLEWAAE